MEECGPCHAFAGFTLTFALQLRKKHGETSVRVRKTSVRLKKICHSTVYILSKTPTHYILKMYAVISSETWYMRGLRLGSAAARLLELRVRILPGAWMSVCCEYCVLSGRGLCDGPITRPEKSYRECWVCECAL